MACRTRRVAPRSSVWLLAALWLCARPATPDEGAGPASAPRPVLVAQLGHTDGVTSVALSADGAHVVTGSVDKTARLWETATGRVLRRIVGHEGAVTSVAFAKDGAQILTGSADQTARLWESATGKEVRRFTGHTDAVTSVAFSPDGARVLTGSADQTARLFETATGKELLRLQGHGGRVTEVAFSPDGAYVLTGSYDKTARLWDAATGREVRRFEGHASSVTSVAFSRDGARVLTGSGDGQSKVDNSARLWETATGREVRRFEARTDLVTSVASSPDGAFVLTGGWDKTAHLWDAATGQEVRRFAGHGDFVSGVAFSRDGAHVLTGSADKTARLFETATGKETLRLEGRADGVTSVAFSRDGTRLLTGSDDQTARLWDATTGKGGRRLEGHAKEVNAVAFSADGLLVVTGSGDDAVGKSVFGSGGDTTARLWDAATGKELRRFEGHTWTLMSVALSPDRARILTGSYDKSARVWDVATAKQVGRLDGHAKGVTSVAWSPDGAYALTGSYDRTARLWETATGKEVRRFEGHEGIVFCVAFSPNGAQVLTGSADHTARLWDAATGREVRRLQGHGARVTSVAFSPDGARVLTGSGDLNGFGGDTTARVWETATGKELLRLEGSTRGVRSVAFSPDGARLLTGGPDGTCNLWDAANGRLLGSLMSFRDGGWAVADPEGRFDASNGGDVGGLHWVVGLEVIALSQLKDRYYEPGLLAKLLGFNKEPLRAVAAFTDPKLYPEVTVTQQDGKLGIHLEDQGGGIGPVVIMVNGKERTADARGPKPDPNAKTLTLVEDLTGDPRLLPGEENRIEVFAVNGEGYLRSRGRAVLYKPAGEKQAPALWAVIAGTSDYRGTALDLKFAAKDAKDFAAALRVAGTRLFGAERTHVTLLENALRDGLVAALTDARQAKAADILVIYLAGHGVNRPEGFYYLTADAETADLADPNQRATTALSSGELVEAIKAIPALKQVLVLDTCASGSFVEALTGKRGAPSSQERAIDRVKDRTGMFVLAGCASDSVSYEATKYGQGLLTYSLLLGMKGGQLRESEYVDVALLFGFAADRVPELAKDIGGVQRPILASPRGGSSFDIGMLGEKERAEVPLHTVRPLFSRPSFQDPTEGADVLGLNDKVCSCLRDETASPRGEALVFVDAAGFPGAFQLSGTYTTKDGVTTVRFRLRRGKEAVSKWIEVTGAGDDLVKRILDEAKKNLPAE